MTSMTKPSLKSTFPKIMGILNVTPDSFSDGNHLSASECVQKALKMQQEGADLIDIGGESTRPGANAVNVQEEIDRVIPVLVELKKHNNIFISVDTSKVEVAKMAIEKGADMINDVNGAKDPNMLKMIAAQDIYFVCMHMQGEPRNMQENPGYADVNQDILNFLKQQKSKLLDNGFDSKKLIWDPGIGFGKTLDHNLSILSSLDSYTKHNPVLLGVSRKSFIKMISDNAEDPQKRLAGSLAPLAKAYDAKVEYVRVHDVYETKQFLDTYSRL
jgi:dihydropteroate synthase